MDKSAVGEIKIAKPRESRYARNGISKRNKDKRKSSGRDIAYTQIHVRHRDPFEEYKNARMCKVYNEANDSFDLK